MIRFIFNPSSDRRRSQRKLHALQAATLDVSDVQWQQTEGKGHAVQLAEQAGRDGCRTVVAVGGDGTVHEVLNGLMRVGVEQRPAIGVVPVGSGNDFAYACGISKEPAAALERAMHGQAIPLDVGRITDGSGRSCYFGNSAGMLFDAAVNIESHRIQRVHGFAMYLTAAVRAMLHHFAPAHVNITMDGQISEHELLLLAIANGPREGGGFMIAPQARNDDGQLECVMVSPMSRLRMTMMLCAILRGTHTKSKRVSVKSFQSMRLESDRAIPIHLDGELWADYEADVRSLELTVLPAAVRVVR